MLLFRREREFQSIDRRREEGIGERRYSAEDGLEILAGILFGKSFGGLKILEGSLMS